MNTRDYLVSVLAILKKHHVVDNNVSESVIDKIYDKSDLNEDLGCGGGASDLFSEFIDEKTVGFNIDCISEDGDYVRLIEDISKATCGEWAPKNIYDSVDFDDEIASVEFIDNDGTIKWEFGQEGTDVSEEFFEKLVEHIATKLTGIFIQEGDDTFVTWVYLPKPVAEDLINMETGYMSEIGSL